MEFLVPRMRSSGQAVWQRGNSGRTSIGRGFLILSRAQQKSAVVQGRDTSFVYAVAVNGAWLQNMAHLDRQLGLKLQGHVAHVRYFTLAELCKPC